VDWIARQSHWALWMVCRGWAVFKEEFSQAKVQRCTVHVDRNVLAKVPRKLKKDVAADLRSIFYAPFKENALEHFGDFKQRGMD